MNRKQTMRTYSRAPPPEGRSKRPTRTREKMQPSIMMLGKRTAKLFRREAILGLTLLSLLATAAIASAGSSFRPAFVVPTTTCRSRTLPPFNQALLPSIDSNNNNLPHRLTVPGNRFAPAFVRTGSRLASTAADEDDDDSQQKNEEDERKRKRDRIKDWIYPPSGPMVKPIRMEDGSVVEDDTKESARIRPKFDSLFAGMPGIFEILGSDDEEEPDDDSSATEGRARGKKRTIDDSWFDKEKQEIMDSYEEILKDMLSKLEDQKKEDQEAVPGNAEAMIKSVLKQEMDREIESTKEARARELLQSYESDKLSQVNSQDISGPPGEGLQKLMDESDAEYAMQQASRAQLEEFLRYERDAFEQATEENGEIPLPQANEDLDRWALDRLEDMVNSRQDTDDREEILDMLEENLDDLRLRMEKEKSRKGAIQPDTMKEWQMYRAIATRLMSEEEDGVKEADIEGKILQQLESWKDYIRKEKVFRKNSGLASGPKLPFDWQESNQGSQMPAGSSPSGPDQRSKVEVRKQVNRMSIEALESLMATTDAKRRQALQTEIEFLKATLESNDYLDVDESFLVDDVEVSSKPVDLKELFASSTEQEKETRTYEPGPALTSANSPSQTSSPPSPFFSNYADSMADTKIPPSTPFFSDVDYSGAEPKRPPPSTPFFTDTSETVYEDTVSGQSKLGSLEEQKLEAMYRRAGAKTEEARKQIKDQWEDFQEIERQKRDLYGLSGVDDPELLTQTKLKYNVSEMMKGDGDVDAEKILATIGPRPTRTKNSGRTDTPNPAKDTLPRTEGSIDEAEVIASLYRANSAVGGGRFKDDPEGNEKQKASFEEYLMKEKEMRSSLDDDIQVVEDPFLPDPGDARYAQEVLASLPPRPRPKRTRVVDEREFSDRGGALASEDDDDDDDENKSSMESASKDTESYARQPEMPEWLRREKEEIQKKGPMRGTFLGSEIDEVFDDTDYDKQMRQLHDYERRRAGKGRKMGIDISDVLGRSAFETDDYADYKYDNDYLRGRQDSWGSASFKARKSNLLEYTELDVAELNSLMDQKDSVFATGVSQYMPRINKPFKEFGAIFRLEGVLLDVTGLQLKAWTQVATEYGYKTPNLDDVRRAAVSSPAVAVKDVFFWSDDFLQCRKVAESHRNVFRQVFNAWMQESKIEMPASVESGEESKGSFAIDQELAGGVSAPSVVPGRSEAEILRSVTDAWTRTAIVHRQVAPSEDAVLKAVLLPPDIAIVQVFRWSTEPREVAAIVQSFREYLSSPGGKPEKKKFAVEPTLSRSSTPAAPLTQNDVMELHFKAWTRVSEVFGFEEPLPEEVMAAFVINNPFIAIRDGFGWTDDPNLLADALRVFQDSIAELMRGRNSDPAVARNLLPEIESGNAGGMKLDVPKPDSDEVFQASFDSWTAVAKKAGLSLPDVEQVMFANSVGPEDAIVTGFQWTEDSAEAEELVKSYRRELAQRRGKWSTGGQSISESAFPLKRSVVSEATGPTPDQIFQAAFDAWTRTAFMSGFAPPDSEQVQFALAVGPEEAIVTGFQWTEDKVEASKLVDVYRKEISRSRASWTQDKGEQDKSPKKKEEIPPFAVMSGAVRWIQSLLDVEMQCGIISYLESYQVNVLLEQAGMANLFSRDKRVTASSGYNRESQQMLGAALRLERRPDHCVVFDTTPYSSTATREIDMKSVSLIGPYPRYELLNADTTSNSFEDLTAMNIRRLFGERVYDQPMLDAQQVEPVKRSITKTKFFWDDD